MANESAMSPATSFLLQLLRQRYGNRLDSDQWAEVAKGIEAVGQQAQALRSVPLQNSDEPFSCFQPYCGRSQVREGHTA